MSKSLTAPARNSHAGIVESINRGLPDHAVVKLFVNSIKMQKAPNG